MAVLYYLRLEEAGLKQSDKGKKRTRKSVVKRKTVSEQVDGMLGSISHDDLKAFVKEQCISDPAFRRSFLSGFLYKSSAESPEKYREQVKNILRSAKGRDHYKEACRYMRRMIKLGAHDRVKNLITTLRNEYPQRKALMDELNKI